MTDREYGYEVTFEFDTMDGLYRFAEAYRRSRNSPEGIIKPPDDPAEDPFDDIWRDSSIVVFVHGADDYTVRAWRIAKAAFPRLAFDWVYDDDGNEVHS